LLGIFIWKKKQHRERRDWIWSRCCWNNYWSKWWNK
jgi:hypothetical protein